MGHQRKNFIVRNESFICDNCGYQNDTLRGSCRNHCQKCLYSKHVDQDVPGDRLSSCLGLMKPISLDEHSKKGKMVIHECSTCGRKIRNMLAKDDDLQAIIELGRKPLME